MLTPYRVLDLTDERGQLTGQMLAQLGAEVIAIEPPGGQRSRRMGPWHDGATDNTDASLRHAAYNRGKASVVLDLDDPDDRDRFLELVRGADVLIETHEPGELERLGLGVDVLAETNPTLVHASITAWGSEGPAAARPATDLTVWASAGPMFLTGDADRAPLRLPGGQAFIHASAEAAGAVVAALYERGTSGRGQHVDVSAQQAAAQATQSNVLSDINGDTMVTRGGGGLMLGGIFIQLLWPCADGHVSVTFLFGSALGVASRRLMEVVHETGHCDAATRDKNWLTYGEDLLAGVEPVEEYQRVKDCIESFCMAHTKAELLELALERKLLIAPVNSIGDVVELEQFASRGYWDVVDGRRAPGPFAMLSETPMVRLGAAPRLGADTDRILGEPPRAPSAGATQDPPRRPLEGLKVLDFMWVMAGPAGTRVLADLGATVIRVESNARIDTARTLQPFKNGENQLEGSMLWANMNAGKQAVTVNPTTPEGHAVIEDLIRWADVVTESFSPKAMRGFGLDYETVHAINPRVVMLSSCLFGQTGPLSHFAGYGTMAAAMTGFLGVTGWPDRAPCGPFGAYTDYISPRFANAALLAAVDHQRRTGEGQYVDFAQAEGALHALAPMILDYSVNGALTTPVGNDDATLSPHGVWATSGPDEWVAVACATDEERAALAALCGGLDDDAIGAWTAARGPEEAQTALLAAGIPAHRIANASTMRDDPQLAHRNHFATVGSAVFDDLTVEGPRFTMSRTNPHVGVVPTMGEHTTDVLTGILGYDDERLVELLISGALE